MGEGFEWKLTPSPSEKKISNCSNFVLVEKNKCVGEYWIIAEKSGFPLSYSWCWRSEPLSLLDHILLCIRNAEQKGWCTAWQTPFLIGQVPEATVSNRINGLPWWQPLSNLFMSGNDQSWARWKNPTKQRGEAQSATVWVLHGCGLYEVTLALPK